MIIYLYDDYVIYDSNFKVILKTVLQHENGKFKDDEDAEVIIENHTGDILQTVSEKYLKHILGIKTIRKTAKLEKSTETFNKLNMKDVASITFNNKIHNGIITIWEDDNSSSEQINSEDELDNELKQAFLERDESESDVESVHVKVSASVLVENKKLK
jgi:antitoxin component YwqK of YwqJK toxin-antitoxin module